MVQHIRDLVSDDLNAVDRVITEKIDSEVTLLHDLATHIIQSGGKRLRPLLVLLASHACNYQGDKHLYLAAMVEFFHTATLLHDDVIDDSSLRRGKKTAHKIWGNKASILVGDYFFIQYMQLLLHVGHFPIMHLFTSLCQKISVGEIQQLENRHNPLLAEEAYFDTIRAKTSFLFAASAKIGGMISEQSASIEQGLYDYGLYLGNAFQLIDDMLDYCSDAQTLGKNIGDDLADGKATLPLIYALKHASSKDQAAIHSCIKNGQIERLDEITAIIKSTNAIDYTKKIAQKESEKAIASLSHLPSSVYKDALITLAHYAVERDH